MAERVGFEPTLPFRVNTLSKRAPSATRPSLRRFSRKVRVYHSQVAANGHACRSRVRFDFIANWRWSQLGSSSFANSGGRMLEPKDRKGPWRGPKKVRTQIRSLTEEGNFDQNHQTIIPQLHCGTGTTRWSRRDQTLGKGHCWKPKECSGPRPPPWRWRSAR